MSYSNDRYSFNLFGN
jgi:hypothetical protein